MKVAIVAKTRMGTGACVGAISSDGQSVRLLAPEHETRNGHFNLEYEIGDVWEITHYKPTEIIPPHVEGIVVSRKRHLKTLAKGDLCRFVQTHMPPVEGGSELLFDGLVQSTTSGVQFISETTGIPSRSTMFWRPDRPLAPIVDESVRVRYRYPTRDGGRTLTYVGFQEPVNEIPIGTLLRVSLAHWWRPQDKPGYELRCYVQLSGWYDDCENGRTVVMKPASTKPAPTPKPTAALSPAASPPTMVDAEEALRRVFGFERFRPAQKTVIDHILHKRDTVAIMPTGSGKSLCYQLPALLFPGLTVVVSPLIALMEDQVTALRELGISAGYLNSSQSYEVQMQIMREARHGELRLLYAAPETLLKPEVMQLLRDVGVDCLAIDEAHCISEWGHDFRPEYRQLGNVRQRLLNAVCLALTATATARVRQDIRDNLGLSGALEVITSFNRKNLFLEVQERRPGRRQLLAFLDNHRGESGLIYCLTKADVNRLVVDLRARGLTAIPYHADLDAETRRAHHRRFTFEEGVIVVATIAFGMGINKSNVRFVVHYGMPKDMESYYQQIGRAGRDGLRADCLLLHSRQDTTNAMYHINNMAPELRIPAQMRLKEMAGFAETRRCRRGPLLRYFDEAPTEATCSMCDNCLAGPQAAVDLTIPAQKFLSCVLRTREMFGTNYIIDVLRGSRNRRILHNRHHELSTYGIGREYSAAQWQSLAGQLVEAGLLRRDMTHGNLSVTSEGRAMLRGGSFHGAALLEDTPATAKPKASIEYDRELFKLLQTKRTELAQVRRVPPYVVFSDRSLQEMATFYPQTVSELLQIHGMGEAKLESYGADMLSVIAGYCGPLGIRARPRGPISTQDTISRAPADERRQKIADWFNQGSTINEIAETTGLARDSVISYLWKVAHFAPGLDPAYLCREVGLDLDLVTTFLEEVSEPDLDELRRLYRSVHNAFDEDSDWLLRLLLVNHTQRNKPTPAERHDLREAISACVNTLPGELPRSGLANLLRGNASGRVANYQDHPAYGQMVDETYFVLMAVIDAMIAEGDLVLGDDRRLYPP